MRIKQIQLLAKHGRPTPTSVSHTAQTGKPQQPSPMKIYSAAQIYIRTGVLVYHNVIHPRPLYSSGKILEIASGKMYFLPKSAMFCHPTTVRRLCCRF
jgi:hypothetical protein